MFSRAPLPQAPAASDALSMSKRKIGRAAALALCCAGIAVPAAAGSGEPVARVNAPTPPAPDACFLARATKNDTRGGTRVHATAWNADGKPLSGMRVRIVRSRSGHRDDRSCGTTRRSGRTACTVKRSRGARLTVYARSAKTKLRVRFAR
jgi:hypothetical protein